MKIANGIETVERMAVDGAWQDSLDGPPFGQDLLDFRLPEFLRVHTQIQQSLVYLKYAMTCHAFI